MKRIFVDTETTGTDFRKHSIWQLAILVEIDDKIVESKSWCMRPTQGSIVVAEALAVGGISVTELRDFPEAAQAHEKLKLLLSKYISPYDRSDKALFYAYNARFDADFLRQWFLDCGDRYFGSWFYSPPIDVMSLAAEYLCEKRCKMENFKLSTVAKELGLEPDGKLHDALVDTELTYLVYQKVKGGSLKPNVEK